MRNNLKHLLAATALGATVMTVQVSAQTDPASEQPAQPITRDDAQPQGASEDPVAQSYVAKGMSLEEARRRVRYSEEAAALQQRLQQAEPTRFAGLYIDDGAQLRVVVRLVGDAEGLLRRYTNDSVFVAEKAATPLVALRNKQEAIARAMAARGDEFGADVDVRTGRLKLFTTGGAEAARQTLRGAGVAPEGVDIEEVRDFEAPTAAILGGSRLDGTEYCDTTICKTDIATTGFTVTNGTVRGVLTAGHFGECVNMPASCVRNSPAKDQTGVTLTYQGQRNAGGEDYEWRTASNSTNTFPNTIRYSTTTMPVTTVRDPTTYAVGTKVCKQGRNTGYTCGTIESTSTSSSYNGVAATWVRVKRDAAGWMCDTGDSGGPMFQLNTALGITHSKIVDGSFAQQCLFMPIQRISSLGLSVVTS